MNRNKELAFVKSVKGIAMISLAAVFAVSAVVLFNMNASSYESAVYGGKNLVSIPLSSSNTYSNEPVLSYKELSADYAALESTCYEWTNLTEDEEQDGDPDSDAADSTSDSTADSQATPVAPTPSVTDAADSTADADPSSTGSASSPDAEATALPSTSPVHGKDKGGLYCISDDLIVYCIFNIDIENICDKGYTLDDFDHIWLNSEDDDFYVVVNLSGKVVDLSDYYILARDESRVYASRVLINCYEAEEVILDNCILTGTLLAPDAVVRYDNTYVYGQVLSASATGDTTAYQEIRFTGYNPIMDGLNRVTFKNEIVREQALAYLREHDVNGLFDDYRADENLRARDLDFVYGLDLSGHELFDIEDDLAYFKELEYLKLNKSPLTELSLTGLGSLLDLDISDTYIERLDLSGAPLLQRLIADNTSIRSLDLTAVPNLIILSYENTSLGWLDFSATPLLEYLNCTNASVNEAEIVGGESLLTKLTTLRIADNSAVTAIDLASLPSLTHLDCASCSISELDIASFPNVVYLRCSNNNITSLDLSEINHIYSVECFGSSLQSLIVTRYAEAAFADIAPTLVQ